MFQGHDPIVWATTFEFAARQPARAECSLLPFRLPCTPARSREYACVTDYCDVGWCVTVRHFAFTGFRFGGASPSLAIKSTERSFMLFIQWGELA